MFAAVVSLKNDQMVNDQRYHSNSTRWPFLALTLHHIFALTNKCFSLLTSEKAEGNTLNALLYLEAWFCLVFYPLNFLSIAIYFYLKHSIGYRVCYF